jgi:hypothetical protein
MVSRVLVVERNEVSEDVKEILTEIEGAFGTVPNLFKTYSHFPPFLKPNWNKVKALMMQGTLSRKTKEAIVVLVSKNNSCSYYVVAHTAAPERVETLGVMELFTAFNKFLDSLNVEVDF